MFIEIEKINLRNEKGMALIDTSTIVALVQQPNHYTRLFDDNGNLVSETQDAPWYALITSSGQVYNVEQSTYDTLKSILTK